VQFEPTQQSSAQPSYSTGLLSFHNTQTLELRRKLHTDRIMNLRKL
jgi:hypothetical protein